jgi:hypothetical protein
MTHHTSENAVALSARQIAQIKELVPHGVVSPKPRNLYLFEI